MNKKELIAISKPILFNTDMTKAILNNSKTVTRRKVKQNTKAILNSSARRSLPDVADYVFVEKLCVAPYQVGDILYVRETWAMWDENLDNDYIYKASDKGFLDICKLIDLKWHPSIHMPKEAARIFLRVTNVRVERLQDITPKSAKLEGVSIDNHTMRGGYGGEDSPFWIEAFAELWDSTRPKNKNRFKCPEYGWNVNPWVWVIEFEKVTVDE